MKIEKEFIPYEQALALKELGFDEELCFGRWTTNYDGEGYLNTTKHSIYQGRDDLNRQCIAPTFSQAFRFFREKYNLHKHICYFENKKVWHGDIYNIKTGSLLNYPMELTNYNSYEETEIECLKKLIEICKKKQI